MQLGGKLCPFFLLRVCGLRVFSMSLVVEMTTNDNEKPIEAEETARQRLAPLKSFSTLLVFRSVKTSIGA